LIYDIVYNGNKIRYKNANTMAEVTHTDKGNGVQMNFYTSLYHTSIGTKLGDLG